MNKFAATQQWNFFTKNKAQNDFLPKFFVIIGTFTILTTEILSFFSALNRHSIAIFWFAFALSICFFTIGLWKKTTIHSQSMPRHYNLPSISPLLFILATTFVIALVAAPNTWDSMTYHMSRVVGWFHHGDVAHHPTHIERQAFYNPWTEYAIFHLYALADGSDRLANMVQWLALAGAGIMVYLIATIFVLSKKAGCIAAGFFLTAPMTVLQSTSTQNDLVCAFWCMVAAYFAIKTILQQDFSLANTLYFSCALGIGVLSKGVMFFYGGIIGLWWVLSIFHHIHIKKTLAHVSIALLLAFALNAPHFYRNIKTYGHPLTSPGESAALTNNAHSPALLLSSFAKNTAIHFRVPHNGWNNAVMKALVFFHRIIGVDINDPRTTWGGRFALPDVSNQEDQAGNPLHAALLAVAFALVFLMRMPPGVRAYAGITIGGFLAFCFFLKWQPWHSRLHLPFFALSAPVFAVVFDAALKKFRLSPDNMARATTVVVWGLSLAALPWVFFNYNRPFFSVPSRAWQSVFTAPREEQYFAIRKDLYKPYREAADALAASGCTRAGLVIGGDDWEYPLWPMMRSRARGTTFTHVLVANATTRGRAPEIPPGICAILHVNGSRVRLQQIQSD